MEYFRSRGYDFAALLLQNSLRDRPKDLSFSQTDLGPRKMIASPEFQQKVRDIISRSPVGNVRAAVPIEWNQGDLLLAVHGASGGLIAKGTKYRDGRWTLQVKISDVYDFDLKVKGYLANDPGFSAAMHQFFVTAGNNAAYLSQLAGAITPYAWQVTINLQGKGNTIFA